VLVESGVATIATVASWAPPRILTGTLAPGQVFASRFRIDRLLGAGGMGAVYKASDLELDIPVALKIVRPEMSSDSALGHEFEERFKRELLTARLVTDRHVVRIHDLGESAGVKFITMQYVDGSTLAAVMRAGRLPYARTLSFAKQIASGLRAAHDVGVIHRDLKPQNILVDADDAAYISDFGLAKSLELTRAGLTHAGELLGTPRYVSPEQIRGQAADQRSDLYALGLIMYEMATGEAPMTAVSAVDLMYRRVQEPAPDPQRLVADLPEYFRCAVLRCLERDPAARYQSAAELLADLETEHAAPVAAATRTIAVSVPVPRVTRSRALVAAALVIAVLGGAVGAVRHYRPSATRVAAAPGESMRIAVLPFTARGGDSELAAIGGGVAEALSAKLFGLPGVTIASGAPVQQARADAALADVARTLGASIVVGGTVGSDAGGLRLSVTADDARTGQRVWAEEFTGVAGDLLTIQDHIYTQLVAALRIKPTTDQLARAVVHPTENIEAYQLYLRGRNAMRGQQNRRNVEAALDFYEQALKRDSTFALAYAGIADGALRLYRTTKEPEWAQKALAAAQQAQHLDDKLVEVHLALASAYQATGKATEAIAMLTTAADMAPTSDDVFRRLGRALLATGRGDEAIAAYQKAIAINPYYAVSYGALGFAYMQLGDYEKAALAYQKMIEVDPRNADGYNDLGAARLQLGEYEAAADTFRRALTLQDTPFTYNNLGIAYVYARKYDQAIPMFEKAVALGPNDDRWIGNLADGYRWAGQRDRAISAYDAAIARALKALQVNPRDAAVRANLALYYAKRGDSSRARRLIADARAIDAANVNVTYAQATIDALAGRTADALDALSAAVAAGYPVAAARRDPDLQSLVTDPRFARLSSAPAAR
jgi:serine/threonine-protein kinase